MEIFLTGVWGIFGLVVGSFVNMCLDRLPIQFSNNTLRQQMLESGHYAEKLKFHIQNRNLTISSPARSFCFSCGHQLAWYENIPVLSCWRNRARCSNCNTYFGYRTLWVEAGHALFYGLSAFLLQSVFWCAWLNIHFSFLIILKYCTFIEKLRHILYLQAGILFMLDMVLVFFYQSIQ